MIQLFNEDNLKVMATMPDSSIDVICIDPPYLYLKNQKLERPFDERLFFSECKRLLKDKGFIVMFGRGVSFYRWNCILDELGMTFKEEIVWDKRRPSNPLHSILRVHESIVIYSKGHGKINKIRVPFQEAFSVDPEKVNDNFKKLVSALGNNKLFEELKEYLTNGTVVKETNSLRHNNVTVSSNLKTSNQTINALRILKEGAVEKTILASVNAGERIHPTQKPVRLLERLLALVIPDKPRNEIVVADWFGGSMSTMEAVHNMGMNGVSTEIDEEYFLAGKARIDALISKPKQEKLDL